VWPSSRVGRGKKGLAARETVDGPGKKKRKKKVDEILSDRSREKALEHQTLNRFTTYRVVAMVLFPGERGSW
jgi:hypothetical protein